MKIIIKTKDQEPSEALNKFIEEKFFTLKKYVSIFKKENELGKTLAEIFVEVEKETKHHRKGDIFLVKAQMSMPGRSILAEEKGDNIFSVVVAAKEELKLEIEKYKLKKIDKARRGQRNSKKEIII